MSVLRWTQCDKTSHRSFRGWPWATIQLQVIFRACRHIVVWNRHWRSSRESVCFFAVAILIHLYLVSSSTFFADQCLSVKLIRLVGTTSVQIEHTGFGPFSLPSCASHYAILGSLPTTVKMLQRSLLQSQVYYISSEPCPLSTPLRIDRTLTGLGFVP